MATVYGVNATKNNTPKPQNILAASQQGSRVRWIHDSYEASTVASGSDIVMGGKVPANAIILPGSYVYHDALGAVNVSVGTSVSGVDLAAAEDVTSAGNIRLMHTVDLFGTETSAAVNIHLTPDGEITGTIRLSLLYAMA